MCRRRWSGNGGSARPMTSATLAAGAAIWRNAADPAEDAEVLLVHRPKYDDWSLPKGKSDPDEHILLTAVREVWEETCVRPVLGPRLPTVEYISWGLPKRVSYWAAFGDRVEAMPGNEIDAVSWLPLGQAREQLAGTHDAPVISAFRPLETVPLILVRHASAGRRADWPGDACLAPYGRSADFSSRTGLADSLQRLLSCVVAERRPAVLCLHRENLPDVLAAACAALGAPAALPADPALPKGGFWVAHATAEAIRPAGGLGPAAAGGKFGSVVPPGASRAGKLAALERY